eukprot:GGOE01041198.1.p1 GENE.GGOE01041198.1~~GGOE01041198.1.p1  ORF type:complete len:242 (-),score=55.98 GGOE01041198.1:59-763(-)
MSTVLKPESPRKKERMFTVRTGSKFDPYYDKCLDMQQQIRVLKEQLNKTEHELTVLKTKYRRAESGQQKGRSGGQIGEFIYLREQRGRDRDAETFVELLQSENRSVKVENEQLKATLAHLTTQLEHYATLAKAAEIPDIFSPVRSGPGASPPDSHVPRSPPEAVLATRDPHRHGYRLSPRARSYSPSSRNSLSVASDPGSGVLNFCTQCGRRLSPNSSLCSRCNTMHLFPNGYF